MTANERLEAEQIERLKYRADKMGFKLVPKADTNLWQITARFQDEKHAQTNIQWLGADSGGAWQIVDCRRL